MIADDTGLIPLAQMKPKYEGHHPKYKVHQLAGNGGSLCGWIMAISDAARWHGRLIEVTCKACVRNRNPTWLRKTP